MPNPSVVKNLFLGTVFSSDNSFVYSVLETNMEILK